MNAQNARGLKDISGTHVETEREISSKEIFIRKEDSKIVFKKMWNVYFSYFQ